MNNNASRSAAVSASALRLTEGLRRGTDPVRVLGCGGRRSSRFARRLSTILEEEHEGASALRRPRHGRVADFSRFMQCTTESSIPACGEHGCGAPRPLFRTWPSRGEQQTLPGQVDNASLLSDIPTIGLLRTQDQGGAPGPAVQRESPTSRSTLLSQSLDTVANIDQQVLEQIAARLTDALNRRSAADYLALDGTQFRKNVYPGNRFPRSKFNALSHSPA